MLSSAAVRARDALSEVWVAVISAVSCRGRAGGLGVCVVGCCTDGRDATRLRRYHQSELLELATAAAAAAAATVAVVDASAATLATVAAAVTAAVTATEAATATVTASADL